MRKFWYIPAVLALMALVFSCSMQRKIDVVRSGNMTATLTLPDEAELPEMEVRSVHRDTLKVQDLDGREVLIMKAVKDENGEMVAHDVIDAAVVTARFRHVAERHGKVDLEFQIIVPEAMQDGRWQLRFYPDMYIMEDSLRLEPVIITGNEYRRAQLRGYQQYEKFLSSIVSDTTKFINVWQLELFLERNIPQVYALKNDTTAVSDEQFASVYGVTERQAVEHYTNQIATRWNNRRKALTGKMYRRYVKSPIVTEGIRLDTIIRDVNGDFIYNYVQTIATRPKLRKVDIVLSGEIHEQDRRLYTIPRSEPLTFYISLLSAFADGTEKYLTKIIERRVGANTACYVDFLSGRADVLPELGNNASEIGRVRENLAQLIENTVFDLDSIVVTASASPEGSLQMNTSLAQKRSESVSRYFDAFIRHYRDSLDAERGYLMDMEGHVTKAREDVPIRFISRNGSENWPMLEALIDHDTVLTKKQKESLLDCWEERDLDQREKRMQSLDSYRYLREHVYPSLRTVRFDFHLHRKGMVKDTVHTTVLDTTYMLGVQAIRDRDYERAVTYLRTYADYNTAVAYCALEYNASALGILENLERTAQVNYMLAVIHSRQGDDQKAVQCYLHACAQEPSFVHRGSLDPEIDALIKRYGLNRQEEEEYEFY